MYQELINVIHETNIETLFQLTFGKRKTKTMFYGNKKNNYESDATEYALMFNVDESRYFILPYATRDNNWATIAESQNNWIHITYISAFDVMNHDVKFYINERIELKYKYNN